MLAQEIALWTLAALGAVVAFWLYWREMGNPLHAAGLLALVAVVAGAAFFIVSTA